MSNGRLSPRIKKKFPTIEEVSFKVLIEAYLKIIELNQYDIDWEEEQINLELVRFMKKSEFGIIKELTIGIERKLFNENKPPINDNNPKKLPRIDINIVSWRFQKGKALEYFFEAKNLYENNYKKKVASQHINRYIDTGIENFRISRYYNGSLVGYVLEGNTTKIIEKLNKQLTKDRVTEDGKYKNRAINHLSSFEQKNYIKNFDCYYESKHLTPSEEEILIKHIFLDFIQ